MFCRAVQATTRCATPRAPACSTVAPVQTSHFEGGASFLAGGKGNDVIEASSGVATVIAHNVGDGNDVVRASAQRVTVSLGGQLDYDDLKLRKDGANLVMETGSGDSTTFEAGMPRARLGRST